MTVEETRQKILDSDEFVLSEIRKLQYLRSLKQVIRNNLHRVESIETESVAEHIFGLNILARYFLPLEDPEQTLDQANIFSIITWHDMDEIESGDFVPWEKTDTIKAKQNEEFATAMNNAPEHLRTEITSAFNAYEHLDSAEARFVKAIDKIDPFIEEYNENGKKLRIQQPATPEMLAIDKKIAYTRNFPCIHRFLQFFHEAYQAEGFYVYSDDKLIK